MRNKLWSQKELDWLRDNYFVLGLKKCSEKLGMSQQTINNIKLNNFQKHETTWLKEEIDWLINEFPQKSTKDLAKESGFSELSITNKAQKLKLKKKEETKIKSFKNMVNNSPLSKDEYVKFGNDFINISSKEHAYILGFIWGDGSVSKTRTRITCSIAAYDGDNIKSIFEKTGKWNINYAKRLYPKQVSKQVNFNIGNIKFHQFLVENDYLIKSGASADKILSKIPENLRHYWWRGYFDADGCFVKNFYSFNITSCYKQNWNFIENLFKNLKIKYSIAKERKLKNNKYHGVSRIIVNNLDGYLKFGKFLYEDISEPFLGLKRKYDIFCESVKKSKRTFEKDKRYFKNAQWFFDTEFCAKLK